MGIPHDRSHQAKRLCRDFARRAGQCGATRAVVAGEWDGGPNVVTGTLFFVGAPGQYVDNTAWYGKLLFLLVAFINVVVFETRQGARMLTLADGERTPTSFKVAGAVSLGSWFLVLYFGRMLPFIGNAF